MCASSGISMKELNFFAFSGSLRKDSYNTLLLHHIAKVLPQGVTMELFDLTHIPLYNADIEAPLPPIVAEFKKKIEQADAIIIATPEYNYSFSGVLKNAIDWASRPKNDNSFAAKPGAILGASNGRFGTVRAQHHLRQVCTAIDLRVLNSPEVMVSNAKTAFDAEGNLIDEKAVQKISKLLETLVERVRTS